MRLSRYFLLFSLGIGLDQLSKRWWPAQLNPGVSFSLGTGTPPLLILILLSLVTIFLAAYTWRPFRRDWVLMGCHALFFAGAVSNLLDRAWFGGVRDIWAVPWLGVRNNLADWLIAGAVILACARLWRRGTLQP